MPKKKSSEQNLTDHRRDAEVYGRSPLLEFYRLQSSLRHVEQPGCGVKHDNLKPRWSLLPLNVMREVIAVLEYGAKKYSFDNWQKVINGEDRYYDAAMRHIQARRLGSVRDKESSYFHLAHAICCLIFWLWFDLKKRRGPR